MKKYGLLTVLALMLIYCNAQNENRIEAAKLIQLTQTSDYFAFVKMTQSLQFVVLDSSKDEKGGIFFFTRELKYQGNTLACGTDSKLKISQLSFLTYDKEVYATLKKELNVLGLKSVSKSNGGFTEIVEAEDFEGKGIYVGSSTRKTEDKIFQYEFIFFKW
jgi:hypothetical protein